MPVTLWEAHLLLFQIPDCQSHGPGTTGRRQEPVLDSGFGLEFDDLLRRRLHVGFGISAGAFV